jgi:hypothetical protein
MHRHRVDHLVREHHAAEALGQRSSHWPGRPSFAVGAASVPDWFRESIRNGKLFENRSRERAAARAEFKNGIARLQQLRDWSRERAPEHGDISGVVRIAARAQLARARA